MTFLLAELLKLRRASAWVVVIVVPLLSVVTGTVSFVMNQGTLSPTWEAYWGQVTLYYGLLFLSIGIAVLSSTLWRMEHRGNWPRLLASRVACWQIVVGKVIAVVLLVAVMQAVLLAGALIGGIVFGRLPLAVPPTILASASVGVLASVGVVALQSLLSMVIRSFAVPIALCLFGCVLSIGLTLAGATGLSMLLPYGHLTRAAQIGNGALSDAATALTLTSVTEAVAPSLALAAALLVLATVHLERRDS